jgi:peroxiredoxin/outer membrane lipoprotein-sorting protein
MRCRRLTRVALAACLGSVLAIPTAGAQTTQPAPQAEAPAPVQADAKAAELISQVKGAYGKLAALDVAGKVSGNFDVAGQKSQQQQEFSGSFQAPNKFRHEAKEGIILGSTGEKLYVYSPAEKVYSSIAAPKDKLERVPQPIANMLFGENPSLLMAISQNPAAMLEGATVKRVEDVTVDAKPYAALHVTGRPTDELTLLIDPNTHLLRRVTMDLRKTIEQRGAPDIKAAEFVVDYTTTVVDGQPKPEQFAWAPPEGARDAAATANKGGGTFDAKTTLVGKPAPDFTLKDLAEQDVKLADAKGSVVLIDFWATWCPPCVEGMPNLERIHKERAKDGVKVFAVNAMEEKDKVVNFVKPRNLTLPVLLDSDGKVGEAYEVDGWPTSVIVKRDGTIHKVLHPVGPEGEKALEAALDEALKERVADGPRGD